MKKILSALMLCLGMLAGCITTHQATTVTLDGAVMVANFDKVKSSIKNIKGLNSDEQATIDNAEKVFEVVYDQLAADPASPITYAKLEEATFALVDTYNVIKKIVQRHEKDISQRDMIRLEDFDTRATRLYEQLTVASHNKDAEAFKSSTEQYLLLLGTVAKVAAVAL